MSSNSVFFIDSRVNGYQEFLDGLAASTEVVLLTGEFDGVDQIAAYLRGRTGIDAIHVISHGSQGALYLGNTVLNSSNLALYESQLSSIGKTLTENGDILLYGCNVAQGNEGVKFISSFSQMTDADIAASVDETGSHTLGGDYELEEKKGNIEAVGINIKSMTGTLELNTAPTFTGQPGKLITLLTTLPPRFDYQTVVALQSDGKILVIGTSENPNSDYGLVRYKSDGSLDASFGIDGKVITDFGSIDQGKSIAFQADGKILMAGTAGIVRYNSFGSIDATFGDAGRVAGYFQSITLTSNGKILAAGNINGASSLARYNSDGTSDATFGTNGSISIGLINSSDVSGQILAVQPDGKILVTGSSNARINHYDFGLSRYDQNGNIDNTFGVNGLVTTTFSGWDFAHGITLQSDGKILVSGTSYLGVSLARYNTDGSLDTSFHGDGRVSTKVVDESLGYGITLQKDGKILVTGSSRTNGTREDNWNFLVIRYNLDGSLDTSFDYDGKVVTDFGGRDFAHNIALQVDGKILVSGVGGEGKNFALARYNIDGSLDTTFAPQINTLDSAPTYTENFASFVLDDSVQIVDAELTASDNYNGAVLSLFRHNGASTQDIFSTASSQLSKLTSGSYFAVDSVTIGRVVTNSEGTLTLAFNANATQSLVNKAMQQITYSNTSDAPPATVQIDWVFSDGNTGAQGLGGALSVTGSTIIQITRVNDAPYLAKAISDLSVKAQSTLSYIIPAGTFIDPDGDTLTWSMVLVDDTAVPPWLTFNKTTKTLSGTPTSLDEGTISLRITATDPSGSSSSDIVSITVQPASNALSGHVYHWMSHTLLSGVSVTAEQKTSTTNSAGKYLVDVVSKSAVGVNVAKELTILETGNAINSADALAALKIAVGRSPNADGSAASPYQLIAADVNKDGKVTSADALAILKMAVKRSDALPREWLFVSESQDFWDETANNGQGGYTISRTNVSWNKDLQATVSQDTTMNLVAVLKGDVNGSWAGPTTGTQSLSNSYFSDLVKQGLGPLSTWGVVAA